MVEGMKRNPHGLICALKAKMEHAELHACSLSQYNTLHMSQCIKKALSISPADAAILLLLSPSPELLLRKLTS